MNKDKKSNILEVDYAKLEEFDEDILKRIATAIKDANPRSLRIGLMVDDDTIFALDFCKSYGDKLAITQFLQASTSISMMEDLMFGNDEDFLNMNDDDDDEE